VVTTAATATAATAKNTESKGDYGNLWYTVNISISINTITTINMIH
jgi:hypothetical protein